MCIRDSPQEVLDGFTEETGVKINYVNFDFDETMLAKLEAAGGGDYDLVIADDYIIETAISEDLVQKLDPSKLSNYKSINSVYQGQFFDPEDEYTVPYGAGVQTIVYDPSLVDLEITGYADLWDKSLEDSVGIIASSRVIDGMAPVSYTHLDVYKRQLLAEYADEEAETENVLSVLQRRYGGWEEDEKIRRRAVAALQRLGYSYEQIRRAMSLSGEEEQGL